MSGKRYDRTMMEKNLIFDYDGTIHDTAHIYIPAFRTAYASLVKRRMAPERTFPEKEIRSWLGYSPKEMWTALLPDQPWEALRDASDMITAEMVRSVADGKARLFPGSEDVLAQLKDAGYHLLILSNCRQAYLQQHRSTFQLDRFFEDYYCSEDFGYAPKYEIFPEIRKAHPGKHLIIGDRFHDLETAEKHGLPSVACAWGYGDEDEFRRASAKLTDIRQLPETIGRLL